MRSSVLLVVATIGYFPRLFAEKAPPLPTIRFTPWSLLDPELRSTAESKLTYSEDLWNLPGSHEDAEGKSFESLSDTQRAGAGDIGFDGLNWDCWMNHYGDFYWDELIDEGVEGDLIALGWTRGSWEGNKAPPKSEFKYWDELTYEEKKAAEELCFIGYTWDGEVELEFWDMPDSSAPTITSTPPKNSTRNPTDWDDWHGEHGTDHDDRRSGRFSWIPLASKVFFVVLIVYPITRGMMIWYSRGGRVLIVRRPEAAAATAMAGSEEDGWRRSRRRRLGRRARGVLGRHRLPYRIRIVRPIGGLGGLRGATDAIATQAEDVLTAEQVDALPSFEFSSELHAPVDDDKEEESQKDSIDASPEEKEEDGGAASCPTPLDGAAEGAELPSTLTRSMSTSSASSSRPSPRHASSSMCSICLDDFEDGETIKELPRCRHFFHTECIYPWLTERRGCCPLCKASVLGTDDGREDNRDEDEMSGDGRNDVA